MSTETKPTSEQSALTAALRNLVAAIDSGLPMPSSMSYHTYPDNEPIISLSFYTDGRDKIAAWTSVYGSKFRGEPRRNTTTDGSQWLTSSTFDLPGVYVQLHGSDPRQCLWLGGCDQMSAANDEQLCTGHAPVDGEVVETVPALTAEEAGPKPRRFRDRHNELWQETENGSLLAVLEGNRVGTIPWAPEQIEAEHGPLAEVSA